MKKCEMVWNDEEIYEEMEKKEEESQYNDYLFSLGLKIIPNFLDVLDFYTYIYFEDGV